MFHPSLGLLFFLWGMMINFFLAKWTFSNRNKAPKWVSLEMRCPLKTELFYERLFIVTNSWLCYKLVYYVSFMIRFLRLRGQVLLLHSRKTILSSSPPNYLRWIFISLK